MNNYSPERLIGNIANNFFLLKNDFTGISFSITGITGVFVNILFVFILTFIFYSVGKKTYHYFFKNYKHELDYFIHIALGYIAFATGIAVLGMLSILSMKSIVAYLIVVLSIGLYPFSKIRNLVSQFLFPYGTIIRTKKSFAFWGAALFVIIAFLRLIPPEIGEDAISYHTSLPSMYLQFHSIIIDPNYSLSLVFPIPQLGEMLYVLASSFGLKDASRYIHFMFYALLILVMYYVGSRNKSFFLGQYAPILFVTAPVVIQISSKANSDFEWIFCWLLSIFIITQKKLNLQDIILSGILFGGVLATKIWTIAFIPLFLVLLLLANRKRQQNTQWGVVFLLFSFLIPLLWYIRSYIITGNPFYPGFSIPGSSFTDSLARNIGFNTLMFSLPTLITFSPIFYICFLFLFSNLDAIKRFKNIRFLLFFILLFAENIFLARYGYSRYLLSIYSLAVFVVCIGFKNLLDGSLKFIVYCFYFVLFSYYFINTVFALPYGFGWADQNKYLSRILSRDNSSYYDFDRQFGKWISNKDLVATYGIYGYYYADFSYIDASYILNEKDASFNLLKSQGVSKLLIQGGDMYWFCDKLHIKNCSLEKVQLLASYPPNFGKYNLYLIK